MSEAVAADFHAAGLLAEAQGSPWTRPAELPRWLAFVNDVGTAVLNVTLISEMLLVFVSTIVRSFTHSSALMGVAELADPFLITISFLGGAISYSRGTFVVITVFVDYLSKPWQAFFAGFVEWIVIAVTIPIGYYSVVLLMANADETTILLGISFAWMTVPITIGCALFILHAGARLLRLPAWSIVASGVVIATLVVLFLLFKGTLGADRSVLYTFLVLLFLVQLILAVPIGFILAIVGTICVLSVGSADMMAVVMSAQRGSTGFILLALPFFVLAGYVMDRADIGARIVDLVSALIGHVCGGLLQSLVVGCYISSCVSGSKASDMAMIGIPMSKRLEKRGYPAHESAAVLAASAAMAEAVPPSIALILVGASTSISTGALFIAGILPAATLAICMAVLIRLRAKKFGWQSAERASSRQRLQAARNAIFPLSMPIILVGGIVGGFGTPTEVSTFAVMYGIILGLFYRAFTFRNFWETLTDASMLIGMIFFTVSVATIASWALTLDGATTALVNIASHLGYAGFMIALVAITMAVAAVLESFVAILILAPLLLPVALKVGVDPLQFGVMLTESFGMGSVLPPIGIALYVSCKICGAKVESTSWVLARYLVVLLIGLAIVAAVPTITTLLPGLLGLKG